MDFLSEENVCGQSLLKLVSRGSAILAELQRLSDNVPRVFLNSSFENKNYSQILFDFEYLKNVDLYEERIQQNTELLDLDENFRSVYFPLLERFYILFESIYKYYVDLMQLITEINDMVFIHHTIDSILNNSEGKKLLGEAFYLYGCMLMLLDNLILGQIREKIIVSYYRYKGGQSSIPTINEVSKLCKNTGYVPPHINPNAKKPVNYPEDYFARFEINQKLIENIIGAIKDDDIYKQLIAYPATEHRSVALANQASMIFILLFFNPNILNKDNAKMREITDKHFYDNWIVPYYMGYIVDLSDYWYPYKAAKNALTNTLELSNIKDLLVSYNKKLEECYKKCCENLKEGVLTEDYVLDNISELLACLRDSNVVVRWMILHRTSIFNKKIREIVCEKINQSDVLSLLLRTSQFEFLLKKMFENLLNTKQEKWDKDKISSCEKMEEIAEYFSGNRSLSKVVVDESYEKWFRKMKSYIESLTYSDSTYAGRKIQQLMKAIDDVEQYHQVNNNLQIKQYLYETKGNLRHMVRIANVKVSVLSNLALISDISYSWECLKKYSSLMQESIKKDPKTALLLKATFMKLSSIMNTPMVRIIQANSPDFISVSKYYSGELIKFVKKVLQIIPNRVFDLLENLIVLLTHKLKKMPLKIDRTELKDFAQNEERTKMANLTNQISVFTESILSMETYLIGIIEVDPKDILEDGIRKELIKLISKILDRFLVFRNGSPEDFENRLKNLAENLTGLKTALEYIQDFINIYGLKIFYEEFNKLINCYIEMEASIFLHKANVQEIIEFDDIPEPDMRNQVPPSVNFMGRLLREILFLTSPKKVKYFESSYAFYDLTTKKEIIGLKQFSLIHKCIGISGLNGLDKLLGFMIISEMKTMLKVFKESLDSNTNKILVEIFEELKGLTWFHERFETIHNSLKNHLKKTLIKRCIEPIQKIGQYVLLRKLINMEISMTCKINSNKLFLAMENLNSSILNDLINRNYDVNDNEIVKKENNVLFEFGKLANFIGMTDPVKKIYMTFNEIANLPLILFSILNYQIPKIQYNIKLGVMEKKEKKDVIEGSYFVVGFTTFVNQFPNTVFDVLMGISANYIRSKLHFQFNQKNLKNTAIVVFDVSTYLNFLELLFSFNSESKKKMEEYGLDLKILSMVSPNYLEFK